MELELLKYIIIVAFAGALSLFLCVYASLKIKDAPGAKYYTFVTLTSAIFTFSYAFELASRTLGEMKFWLRIEYLALPFIPVFTLLMCFEYVGHKLRPWMYYFLFVIPVLTIFMHNTNDLHHIYYTSMEVSKDTPFPILRLVGGPWFYIHSIFVFCCTVFSVIILLKHLKQSLFRFRMQILLMVAGIIVPIIATHFYINDLSPYGIDLGPVSMSITFLLHGAALISFQMFNVAPIARDTVFENMQEGVIVLNQNERIVDFNTAMLEVIPQLKKLSIGKSINEILNENQTLAEIIKNGKECDYELSQNGEIAHFHIRFSLVHNKKSQYLGQIISFVNVTERVKMQKQLKQLASLDGLTQVFNRTFFMDNTEKLYDELIEIRQSIAIIMFDIDHFKMVNDTFGHDAGDLVLKHVVTLTKAYLRKTDIFGRYGGEEFIICLPNTTIDEAYELANFICLEIASSYAYFDDQEIRVTSSFGISHTADGQQYPPIKTLIRQADQALYMAKKNGRNHVNVFEQEILTVN
jgi:diguanylate cyclase (GGDEF)-like protein/PAS domain S-box-containing protein